MPQCINLFLFFLCSNGYDGTTEDPGKHKLLQAPVKMKELAETFGMLSLAESFCRKWQKGNVPITGSSSAKKSILKSRVADEI